MAEGEREKVGRFVRTLDDPWLPAAVLYELAHQNHRQCRILQVRDIHTIGQVLIARF